MKMTKIEQDLKHFKKACREKGVKYTHQRMEIFRELVLNSNHPDAEAVYRGVHKRIPAISLDTVYRTLWLLKDLGLIITLGPTRERTRFDANLTPHHHFVCSQCGGMDDFYSEELNELKISEQVKNLGEVKTIQINIQGVCHKCSGNA